MLFKQKLFYFFPILFCFCLPFGTYLLSPIAAVWVFVSFFNINKEQFIKGIKNKNSLLMFGFFVLTCISAILSSNGSEALTAIEIKLTCLFFPYLLFCFSWPKEIIKRMIISFVSGCFFACVYLIARAFMYAFEGKPDYFFYTSFSDFIHPSYFAMYLIMASAFILLLYNDWFKNQKNIRYSSYFFVTIFSICVFLCSSKIGLISFFVCAPIVLIKRLKINFTYKSVAILALSGSIVSTLTYKLFPESFSRLNSLSTLSLVHIDKTSTESTAVRVLIWQQSLTIIQNNLIVGTGVGDANDELYLAYEKNGLTGALSHHLNAHSQYFQTFIGMGMIGFGILLLLTFGQLMNAVIKKNYLLIIFSILIVLNFLVESMLQTAAGILFFTLFYSILTMIKEKDLQVD